ncbi:hypothetical protein [Dehalobacter sp. TeCB1]|uniref:XkdQ/YqbQ family protein n=1 Tax=Dehalobacter sp. TeCB1 TaxID=1843715 RepID=UPI00083B7294|nr:hypothetical protein [Dehalobacter sp. TeCB1]OCZ53789.1 hypothetical protein A7D23_07455 [Dehalobacter sp. TeCB1]
MAIKLYGLENGKFKPVYAGNITWQSAADTLAQQLDFTAPVGTALSKYFSQPALGVGSIVSLQGKAEILRGIVIKESRTGELARSFTCLDFGFYMGQSQGIYQFNKMAVKYAIGKILEDFKIKHNISNDLYKVFVTKIYKDVVISDILKDLLDLAFKETGKKYIMEMRGDTFFVVLDDASLKIAPKIQLAVGTPEVVVSNTISSPTRELSIENMKNIVVITSGDEDKPGILAEVQNDALIRKFGRLQEVQSVSDKDKAQAKNMAQNLLAELGKVVETSSFEVVGHEDLRAYRRLDVNEPITGLTGTFRIISANHSYSEGIHKTALQLELS